MNGVPRVKICGLRRREDVRVADAAGADYVGVVLTGGFGRSVAEGDAAALVEGVHATPVAVLVDETVAAAVRKAELLGAGVIQLHGHEPAADLAALRGAGPWRLWKAVRVRAPGDVEAAVATYRDLVDGFLLEGWKDGVVGGGGARLSDGLDLDLRAALPDGSTFVLAGGLTPDSVAAAVARFGPDVVDVSSGVESEPGRKNPDAVRRFIRHARGADGRTPAQSSEKRA